MTRSKRSPAAAQAGSISAALPTRAMESGLAGGRGRPGPGERLDGVAGQPVDIADLEPTAGAGLVDLDRDAHAVVHGHGQRLGAAHPAQAGGQRHRPAQDPAEVLPGGLGECLVRPLQDPLRPDVDPRPGGHLAIHRQALPFELAEDVPGRPLADEVRVGDEHPRRPRVGPHHAHRLAATGRAASRRRPTVGARGRWRRSLPRPRGSAGPAVDDEVVGVLGDLRVEVVHEHPKRGFLLPAAARQGGAARCADRPRAVGQCVVRRRGHRDSLTTGPSHATRQGPVRRSGAHRRR